MKKIKQLLITITLMLLCFFPVCVANATSVTGSAVKENLEEIQQSEIKKVEYVEVVQLYGAGVACGLVFSFFVFMISSLINLFFDIVRKS